MTATEIALFLITVLTFSGFLALLGVLLLWGFIELWRDLRTAFGRCRRRARRDGP